MTPTIDVRQTRDPAAAMRQAMKLLKDHEVLVGIPADKNTRRDGEAGGPIGNAALGYINEFGSPKAGMPTPTWFASEDRSDG